MGVLAVAGVLLPLVPSWAQQPAGTGAADPARGPRGRQKRGRTLERQKQHIMQEAQELQRLRAALEDKSRAIDAALQKLQRQELDLSNRALAGTTNSRTLGLCRVDSRGWAARCRGRAAARRTWSDACAIWRIS